jgi:hypothetical protein
MKFTGKCCQAGRISRRDGQPPRPSEREHMKKILTCAAIVLMTLSALGLNANADDMFYGSTNSSSIALIDASNASVLNNFEVINTQTNNALGTSLRIASNGTTIFGLSQSGALYTLDLSHTVMDVNHTLGYDATLQSSGIGVSNIVGLAFVSPTLLDVSTSSSLFQYSITTHSSSLLFNFAGSTMIAGIAETPSALLGMQYSPSPGGVDQIGPAGAITQGGRLPGVTQTAFLSLAMGQSGALYVSDGNNNLFTYNLITEIYNSIGTLNGISVVNSFVAIPELDSFTMFSLGVLTLVGLRTLRRRRLMGFLA